MYSMRRRLNNNELILCAFDSGFYYFNKTFYYIIPTTLDLKIPP